MIASLAWLIAALAAAGCAYSAVATLLACRFLARAPAPAPAPHWPAVSVLKPLYGAYEGMGAVLEGYCDQDYGGPVQIVFGVQNPADRAVAVVRDLIARRPDADIALVTDNSHAGANRKVANIIGLATAARHDVLVLSDADIVVRPDYLSHVVRALAAPGVGAATCLYVGRETGGIWSSLGAMALTYSFLPNAVLGKVSGMAQPCFGSTIALRRSTLEAIGGFERFADVLADDYEMGAAVRAQGQSIAMPPTTVAHLCLEPEARNLIDHELRWGRTVRQIDPAGYAGSVITYPLPLALLAATLMGFSVAGLVLILTAFGVRLACKFAMDAATGASGGRWWMIPARDVLSFMVFVASFAVVTVDWQGQRFRVGRDGVLSHP